MIIIPETVANELEQGQAEGEDIPDISDYPWIQIKPIPIPNVIRLVTDLGRGEAGVLALALEEQDTLVILDDLLARHIAELQGIKITGTAGILLKAKEKGYIKTIAPLIKQLLELGFWLSDRLQQDILRLAGELPE